MLPIVTAIAMGIGTIYAELSVVFDRTDEGSSAVMLPILALGLVGATALLHRRPGS